MTITQLIGILEQERTVHGDVGVEIVAGELITSVWTVIYSEKLGSVILDIGEPPLIIEGPE